jgi:Zn finger protein HypA/HybF involved in hydrogenase expression
MMFDLFGNYITDGEEKKLTFEQEYIEYIASTAWKRIRAEKIKQAGGNCEKCGISKWSVVLGVHHKTYKHFKHERMDELEVLCPKCHGIEDEKRKADQVAKKPHSPLVRGFENWMNNNPNRGYWRELDDNHLEQCWEEFIHYINRLTGKEYKAKFKRMDDWY